MSDESTELTAHIAENLVPDAAKPLPQYDNTRLTGLTAPELIELMRKDEDRVPRNVIDECARRGEAMLDRLTDLVDDDADRVQVEDLPFPQGVERSEGERQRLLEVLDSVQWNKSAAARVLRCSRMTLYRKIAKYEIDGDLTQAGAA